MRVTWNSQINMTEAASIPGPRITTTALSPEVELVKIWVKKSISNTIQDHPTKFSLETDLSQDLLMRDKRRPIYLV